METLGFHKVRCQFSNVNLGIETYREAKKFNRARLFLTIFLRTKLTLVDEKY